MAREYELVLMLDPEAPDNRRDEIATGARQRIESAGELKHADDWGVRTMAYEIRQRNEADNSTFLAARCQCFLKYCTSRSCFSAAARLEKVPRFLRLPSSPFLRE